MNLEAKTILRSDYTQWARDAFDRAAGLSVRLKACLRVPSSDGDALVFLTECGMVVHTRNDGVGDEVIVLAAKEAVKNKPWYRRREAMDETMTAAEERYFLEGEALMKAEQEKKAAADAQH